MDTSIALGKEAVQASWSAEAVQEESSPQRAVTAGEEALAIGYSIAGDARNTFTLLEFHQPDSLL